MALEKVAGTLAPSKILSKEKLQLCDICYEEKPANTFFGLSCSHKFCKDCLSEHLETNIVNGLILKIPCM